MTDQKINGGWPAFPLGSGAHGGMSLRDYFAAHFAVAMMTATSADSDFPNLDYQQEAGGPTLAERVAAIAYRLADAKLKAWEDRAALKEGRDE